MELLETEDPDKKLLIERSDRHKRELKKELSSMKEQAEKMLTNALIIGGSLALTYFIVRQLGGSKNKKRKAKEKMNGDPEDHSAEQSTIEEPSILGQVGSKVMNQVTLILLDIAKEKLLEYLDSRKQRNENS